MNASQQVTLKEEDAQLHGEVTKWRGENRLWMDEVEIWRKEHEQALRELAEFERKFLHESRDLIDRHVASLSAHDQRLTALEHALADHVQGKSEAPYEGLVQDHQQVSRQHSVQRGQHARAKEQFVMFMEHRKTLQKAIGQDR